MITLRILDFYLLLLVAFALGYCFNLKKIIKDKLKKKKEKD